MKDKKKRTISILLAYAGNYKALTFVGLALSAISMFCSIVPYVCIWLVVRDLIVAMPKFKMSKPMDGLPLALLCWGLCFILLVCYVPIWQLLELQRIFEKLG